MKVILLTQYFPPEIGAPQNRLFAMARALRENGADITVLTAMPNYPEMRVHEGYRRRWKMKEVVGGIPVVRAWIFVSKGRGIVARLLNYFSFVFSSLVVGLVNLRKSDILLVESPPLFLGITAMWLARAKGAKLVFNVSDLWPESAVQLGLVRNRALIALSTWLEMRCYHRSALITGQTQGIVEDIRRRCPGQRVVWVPNGADLDALTTAAPGAGHADPRKEFGLAPGTLLFAYAGIIGHAQGLEVVLQAAALLAGKAPVAFLLIGEGPERERLMNLADQLKLTNVRFIGRMPRTQLIALLRGMDGVVVPLRRNDLFKGAIPSKIFEAMALSKPVLLGVEGEAKQLFIDGYGAGLAFKPEDPADLAMQVMRYVKEPPLMASHGANGLRCVATDFNREVINKRLWGELQKLETD